MYQRLKARLKREFDPEFQQLNKLKRQPRYTKGEFKSDSLNVKFPDGNSFVFMYNELFKREIYKFSAKTQAPFIIDCGANIGMSVLYFKSIYPLANIIAFEPEKIIRGYLENNLAKNNVSGVNVHPFALWKEACEIQFVNEGSDANRIEMLYNDAGNKPTYPVQAVKLSNYIDKEVDLLKIDIEGAELEVLKEIVPKLYLIDRLFIEYHSALNDVQNLAELVLILEQNNFRYYIDSPNSLMNQPFVDSVEDANFSFDFFLNIFAFKPGTK